MTTLSLGSEPHSVQHARRWVVDACRGIGRPDVLECAEAGVSELVTNALLHADAPIQVRLRGTREHPRVEVRDASTSVPVLPDAQGDDADDELDGVLLTFGRGLSIVSRAAEAWGVEIEADGKVIWFSPASDLSENVGPQPEITYTTAPVAVATVSRDADDVDEIVFRGVPLHLFVGFQHHFDELRREMRLLSFGDSSPESIPSDLAELFALGEHAMDVECASEVILEAQHRGVDVVDLNLTVPRRCALRVEQFIAMLDLTDEFCREERLLALARTSEQRAFQNWFLGEIIDQSQGRPSTTWSDAISYDRHSSAS